MSELDDYLANRLAHKLPSVSPYDAFISDWQNWLNSETSAELLRNHFGRKYSVSFSAPESISVEIHDSPAGRIPVVTFGQDSDFENFIVSLIYHGKTPADISQMGASLIYGKTQRFLTLSRKFYSNVQPELVNLSPEDWREKSMVIRREHELTHYYTLRFYGSASNNLHDELIADFMGLYSAFGRYDAGLFRHFMGIDGTREGRLSLYTSGLSREAGEEIAEIAWRCSDFLEHWQDTQSFRDMDRASRTDYLCALGIRGMLER